MKAMVLNGVEELEIKELDAGAPGEGEIIIDVKACGVCGTDLHMYHGDKGAFDNSYPLIMGHEFSGVVSAAGPGVKKIKAGDRVCVDPNMYCGHCRNCKKGLVHFCENMIGYGTTLPGGFAGQCRVLEQAAYRIPDKLSFEHAALVEPVSCCMHGIDRCNIHPGDTVAVIGMGAIGMLMLQLAFTAGAARVVAVEPVAEKRAAAEKLGACLAIDPLTQDVKTEVEKAGIESLDCVIECAGLGSTMEMAINIASPAATVMLFSLTPPDTKITVLPLEQIFKKEITITGSYVNPLVSQRVIDLLASGRIDLDTVITDRIPIEDAVRIFTDNSYRSHGKILVTMD